VLSTAFSKSSWAAARDIERVLLSTGRIIQNLMGLAREHHLKGEEAHFESHSPAQMKTVSVSNKENPDCRHTFPVAIIRSPGG
jgi:hypothetical protein